MKNTSLLMTLACAGLLVACVENSSKSDTSSLNQKSTAMTNTDKKTEPEPMIVGGKTAVNPHDADVVKAAGFAAWEVAKSSIKTVKKAETQVVAGRNYFMTIELMSGAVYDVVVYENLQSKFTLTSAKKISGGS